MAKILVAGLINIETTLQVGSFPIQYKPTNFPFFGVHTTISGVGYNIAKALTTLGDEVHFLSIVGNDWYGDQVRRQLKLDGISDRFILSDMPETAQSVILYDQQGKREIFCDLKDIQDRVYPQDVYSDVINNCQLCVLCNINFARALLQPAKSAGKRIATDVHTISDLDDPYNRDFMQAADILFMSDELLPTKPEDWIVQIGNRFSPEVAVIGMGKQGSLIKVREHPRAENIPAFTVRPIVNTIGAGDALFSAFIHNIVSSNNPYESIRKASVFAGYKIGEKSAVEGFLDNQSLEELYNKVLQSQE